MRKPEDLIGRTSNSNNDDTGSKGNNNNSNSSNDNSGSGTSYAIRYSSADFLAEAILIAGQPMFLVVERDSSSISIKSSVNVEGKILKPVKKEAYLSDPYSFLSEQEIHGFENEARDVTLAELYLKIKSLCQLFIVADNNHISLLSADITYTYYQDRLGLTHYLFFIGKPGSGKSNNLTLIKLLGYRTFMSTDMTPANVYQFLGSQEEAIGTLCIDEANSVDENHKLMEIYKTGYVKGNRVVRTDIHNGRVQNAYFTFCYKAFAGERLPDAVTANGLNERLIPLNCYDGNPKYDIAEIISPAGEQEYQQLLDEIVHTRNLLFMHRLIHWFKSIPNPTIKLIRREKQLFISLIRIYRGEGVWPEIKSAIRHFIFERRGRQMDTLDAYLFGLIKRLVKNNNSTELKSSNIWGELKSELAGNEIPNKPLSYYTERFGLITQTQVTKMLREIFGAIKPRNHGDANRLVFNSEILERLKMTYEVSIDSAIGIDGDDGDDSRYGMDVFVEDSHSTTSTDVNVSTEKLDSSNSDDVSHSSSNETVKLEGNQIDGDFGIEGIDNTEDDDNHYEIVSQTKSDTSHLSSHHDDIHLENAETDQSLTNTNNQMRIATTGSPTYTHTNNLSQLSQLSQSTKEKIAEFFYDDPELPYHPPPPHNLGESPCKSIIRIDNHSLYYCTLHPDIRSYHLDSIEHHIKYKNAEQHKLEILKLLDTYHSVR
jgi:hypothetical protein